MGMHAMYDSWRRRPRATPVLRTWRVRFLDDDGRPDCYHYHSAAEAEASAAGLRRDGYAGVSVEEPKS